MQTPCIIGLEPATYVNIRLGHIVLDMFGQKCLKMLGYSINQ